MKKVISLFAVSAIGMPAMAADLDGFYGSAGAGLYQLESGAFDEVSPSIRFLGGYTLNRYMAVEASYARLFEASEIIDDTRYDIDGNVWELSTKFTYPLANRFSPYGRLGYSYVDMKALVSEGGDAFRTSDHDNAFTWAVGTTFALNNRLALGGEIARTNIDEGDLDFLSVNFNYQFGAR